MMESKYSNTFFKHLWFYYSLSAFSIPICATIDNTGISIYFGFWGLVWYWKKETVN